MPNHEDRTDAGGVSQQYYVMIGATRCTGWHQPNATRADGRRVPGRVPEGNTRRHGVREPEHVKAWLLQTVNRCRDPARSGWKRAAPSPSTEWEPQSDSPRATTETLPYGTPGSLLEQQRTVVHLHYVEGYSTDDRTRARLPACDGCR